MFEDMTLGQALQLLGTMHACACLGPPPGTPLGSPCYCALAYRQARALQRGAHIAVKLIAQVQG